MIISKLFYILIIENEHNPAYCNEIYHRGLIDSSHLKMLSFFYRSSVFLCVIVFVTSANLFCSSEIN